MTSFPDRMMEVAEGSMDDLCWMVCRNLDEEKLEFEAENERWFKR